MELQSHITSTTRSYPTTLRRLAAAAPLAILLSTAANRSLYATTGRLFPAAGHRFLDREAGACLRTRSRSARVSCYNRLNQVAIQHNGTADAARLSGSAAGTAVKPDARAAGPFAAERHSADEQDMVNQRENQQNAWEKWGWVWPAAFYGSRALSTALERGTIPLEG